MDHIIARDFSPDVAGRVKSALASIDSPRVQLALLKLSKGSFDSLLHQIEYANRDDRDTLSAAEYPRYSGIACSAVNEMTTQEREAIYEADWSQYARWFAAKTTPV